VADPAEGDAAGLAAGLVTVVLWGSAFVGIRAAGETLSPAAITAGRLAVSSVILTAVALARRERLPARAAWLPTTVFGLLFLGGYSIALNAAERRVDAGTAAMIVNTGPLLIAVLAGVFLREGFPRALLGGCVVALTGCVLIALATAESGAAGGTGLVLLAIATAAYASAVVVQKAALRRGSAFQVTWLGCAVATVACLPFAPALAGAVARAGWRPLAATAYLGAMPTALGFATWSFALARGSAGRAAALNYLIPVVAVGLGWAYLGERPSPTALAGGALCISGVYLARSRSR
jgi:drug/metabolite transporter (DMT)-like permease